MGDKFETTFKKLRSLPNPIRIETCHTLLKVVNNVLDHPKDSKVRSLKKGNNVVKTKILAREGGIECLRLLGFLEDDNCFTLPVSVSREQLENVAQALKDVLENKQVEEKKKEPILEAQEDPFIEDDIDVERCIIPRFQPSVTNPFLKSVEQVFHNAIAFDHEPTKKKARNLIPLEELTLNAQEHLRNIQRKIKKEGIVQKEPILHDLILLELLNWFKSDFFTWVNSPACEFCGSKTKFSHMSKNRQDLNFTDRVEVHTCDLCHKLTNFPRYNDLNILLETRKGRCGEWAQVFTLMCRALGWDARYVSCQEDHVWTEVYSMTESRWIHCDPCENAFDTPLMYECGWKKQLTYVIAYTPEEVQDVTWRYVSDHKQVLSRRKQCSERDLIDTLITLRKKKQVNLSEKRKQFLNLRLALELAEFLTEKKPSEDEECGRTSGSLEWRLTRGETKMDQSYFWDFTDKYLVNNSLTFKYCTASDNYEIVFGDENKVIKKENWEMGVFNYENILKKEESDWNNVYLARTEGANTATISWKFSFNSSSKVLSKVSIKFGVSTFENGKVEVKLHSNKSSEITFDHMKLFETSQFEGDTELIVTANLSGGKGNVAWQHTQLFRQSIDSKEFPFIINFNFKNKSDI